MQLLDRDVPASNSRRGGVDTMDRFAGVDCHPSSHPIAVIDAQGRLLAQTTIPSTPHGYREALAAIDGLGSVVWGLEGTGTYGRPFADYLVARGAIVYEVPGAVTKRYRKHSTRPGKSSPIDAKAIAEALLRARERLPRCFGSTNLEALRVLYDHRDRLVRDRTQAVIAYVARQCGSSCLMYQLI